MNITKSLEMQERAKKRIPGKTQLLSKRPEMFAPNQWPGYYSRAKGVEIWDLDDNCYMDMSISGIGANVLGYADPDVDAAVYEIIKNGSSSTFNAPEEVELAEYFCELHPWAQMVRYARSGGEAMALAVRIARAYSGKDKIAFCGYHGWMDWYLAANLSHDKALDDHLLPGLESKGVPRGLTGTALPFRYNQIDDLKNILSKNKNEVGTIVMEPIRDSEPLPGFLEEVRALATENKAVFVIDEITAANRLTTGGAHLLYKIEPDIAVFAKAISNGYPMAVILGREEVMQVAQETFISSTNWTERIGPTAALATMRKHKKFNVAKHLIEIGKNVQSAWIEAAEANNLSVQVSGIYPLSHFSFEYNNGQELMTLYVQMMLERGILGSNRFYATFAHSDEHVQRYRQAIVEVFKEISLAQRSGTVSKLLKGPVAHSGFKRLT